MPNQNYCHEFVGVDSAHCDELTDLHSTSERPGNDCFQAPLMHMLFATFAPCFRQSSLCHGDWVQQARKLPFDPKVVNVAWHIRVGDKTLYDASSSYFRKVQTHTLLPHVTRYCREVLGYMTPFLRGRRSNHFLIGGVGWDQLFPQYVSRFELLFAEYGLSQSCQVTAMFLTVKDSLLHMMVADVVVSTSSSFTDIVALFSAFPVVISPPPKHGISSNMLEYMPDGAYIDGWTVASRPNYLRNTYRSFNMTPAEVVSEALFKRLGRRFPVRSP